MHVPCLVKISWHLLKFLSGHENTGVSGADNSVKIWPLAIPNWISTISMHIPNLAKIHWRLHKLSYDTKYWRTYDWRRDGGTSNVKPKYPATICGRYKILWIAFRRISWHLAGYAFKILLQNDKLIKKNKKTKTVVNLQNKNKNRNSTHSHFHTKVTTVLVRIH